FREAMRRIARASLDRAASGVCSYLARALLSRLSTSVRPPVPTAQESKRYWRVVYAAAQFEGAVLYSQSLPAWAPVAVAQDSLEVRSTRLPVDYSDCSWPPGLVPA